MDRRTLFGVLRDEPTVRYEHQTPGAEPAVWIAAVGWRGSHFAATVSPVIPQVDQDEAREDIGDDLVTGTRGHVVFGRADDRLALWTVAPSGQRTGAWVEDTKLRRERAAQLLTLVEGRVVTGVDQQADLDAVQLLADAAKVALPAGLGATWLDLFDALGEVAEVRRQAAKTKPPAYRFPLDGVPPNVAAALRHLKVAAPVTGAEPAAAEVLAKCWLLEAAVQAWRETEVARLRRKGLHQLGGPTARPLPPRWLGRLQKAYLIRIGV